MKTIENRRSIRKYSDKTISEEELTQILSIAMRTPTMGNLQLYSVVITRNKKEKLKLSPAHFNQPMLTGANVVLTFCADFRRTTIWANNRKAIPGYDNFLSFMNAATDALLYCQTVTILLEEKGWGTCFLGTTIYNPQMIIEVLNLPKLVMPIATLTVGYPAEHPEQNERLPVEAIIHRDSYKDYTKESIDKFYLEKESLSVNKEFININKKETLAQVFTDIRYTKKDNETLSKNFIKVLQSQGFSLK